MKRNTKKKPRIAWKRKPSTDGPHSLDRLGHAITLNRSHDYLNPGFGQRHRPEWMEILVVMVAQ